MSPIEVQITDAVSMLEESVVTIGSIRLARDFRYGTVPIEGQGTGVVVDEKGYIVTGSVRFTGDNRDQTSIHQLRGLPSASGSPSQLHVSGRAARTGAATAGDTPASLTTQHPYPRTTRGEPQEQFRDASSIAGRNFTPVKQPAILMSDGSLGPAAQLTTYIIMATGYLSPNLPRIGKKLVEAPAESRPGSGAE